MGTPVSVRLDDKTQTLLEDAAHARGIGLSTYLREIATAEAHPANSEPTVWGRRPSARLILRRIRNSGPSIRAAAGTTAITGSRARWNHRWYSRKERSRWP